MNGIAIIAALTDHFRRYQGTSGQRVLLENMSGSGLLYEIQGIRQSPVGPVIAIKEVPRIENNKC